LVSPGVGVVDLAARDDGALLLGTDSELRGVLLDQQGAPVDPAGFVIGPPPMSTAVTPSATGYVATWTNFSSILAARITPAGVVMDPGGVEVATPLFDNVTWIDAGSDGTNTVIVWHASAEFYTDDSAYIRLDPSGAPLDPAPVTLAGDGGDPTVAVGPGHAFLTWTDQRNQLAYFGLDSIAGARLDPAGAILDDPPLTVSTSANGHDQPAIAYDGQNLIVAWADDRNAPAGDLIDVYAARITPQGELVHTATGIAIWASCQPEPSEPGQSEFS
jgi:hypothetical protein